MHSINGGLYYDLPQARMQDFEKGGSDYNGKGECVGGECVGGECVSSA